MAFNWQTFRTRSLTAAVFVIVMLGGLLWNYWSFFILFSVIHFGCWWEYLKLTEKIHHSVFNRLLKIGMMLIGYSLLLWLPLFRHTHGFSDGISEYLFWLVPVLGIALTFVGYFREKAINPEAIGFAALGVFYISLSLALMISLFGAGAPIGCTNGGGISGEPNTVYNHFIFPFVIIPLTIITALWINDTMAYIVGSIIGKTPLTKISPKKTWEGTIGGILLSIVVTGLIFSHLNPQIIIRWFHYSFSNEVWYIVAAIAAIAGTFGDILESKLKRMAGVKDSGSIMPGHGGFLDRFDSLLLATPFVWLYIVLFAR